MSKGNLKDNGNKGNNFPYQLSNLQLLSSILGAITGEDLIALGYEKLSVGASSVALTVPAGAKYALINVQSTVVADIAVRYLELGNTVLPSASEGLGKSDGDYFDVKGLTNLQNFRAIRTQPGTHTLHIQYYS